MKLHLKVNENKEWWFVLTARNGQILMTSETYVNKRNAVKSMRKIYLKMDGVYMFFNGERIIF